MPGIQNNTNRLRLEVGDDLEWEYSDAPPSDWAEAVRVCGGGFFHTPAALDVSLPPGDPFFARGRRDGVVQSVAMGIRNRCRLSRWWRHYHLASPPAGIGQAASTTTQLVRALSREGAAEIVIDSFDAPADFPVLAQRAPGPARTEHRISTAGLTAADLHKSYSSTHRRHASRGEREGWQLRTLSGIEASELLYSVQGSASERAHERGDGFATLKLAPSLLGGVPDELSAPWSRRCFASYAGEALLAVALVGWGNGRGFYLIGGSTPEGYKRSAAIWTQWQIMSMGACAGHTTYNLGGTPGGAEEAGHPSHGLFRFKTGYGSQPVACKGSRWIVSPSHHRTHRVLARVEHQIRRFAGNAS